MTREEPETATGGISIRALVEDLDKIELVDAQVPTEAIKQDVVLPYLEGYYLDQIQSSDAPSKGIPRIMLTQASVDRYENVVLRTTGADRRTFLFTLRRK